MLVAPPLVQEPALQLLLLRLGPPEQEQPHPWLLRQVQPQRQGRRQQRELRQPWPPRQGQLRQGQLQQRELPRAVQQGLPLAIRSYLAHSFRASYKFVKIQINLKRRARAI